MNVDTGQELAKLTASDGGEDGLFGASVALDGGTAIVGAFGDNAETGAAYAYDLDPEWDATYGGAYDDAGNWQGLAPSLGARFDVAINPDSTHTVTGPSGASKVGALTLADGAGVVTLDLQAGGGIVAPAA